MSISDLQALLTVTEVAEMFEVPNRVVRKAVKAGTIPGAIAVLGKTGFDPTQVASWTPPEPGTRVVGAKRSDGRSRYRIYLSQEGAAKLLAEGYDLTDPRIAAKARREARNAAKAGAEGGEEASKEDVGGDDLFADFGV